MSEEKIFWLDKIRGVITEDGIRYTGSEEAYLKFLRTFKRTLKDKSREIEESYKNGDMELCTIKVHALKSTARIIGARELSALAEKLENAGRHKDMEFFAGNIEKLIEDYRSYGEYLRDLPDEDELIDRQSISADSLKEAYEALKFFVSQMDTDAVKMILDEMSIYILPEKDEEIFEALNRKILNFDWDGMESLLQ